jgi:hypothetical protein
LGEVNKCRRIFSPKCQKRGRGGRGVWGEFRRARAFRRSEAEAVSYRDSFGKKFGFHSGETAELYSWPLRAARYARIVENWPEYQRGFSVWPTARERVKGGFEIRRISKLRKLEIILQALIAYGSITRRSVTSVALRQKEDLNFAARAVSHIEINHIGFDFMSSVTYRVIWVSI